MNALHHHYKLSEKKAYYDSGAGVQEYLIIQNEIWGNHIFKKNAHSQLKSFISFTLAEFKSFS